MRLWILPFLVFALVQAALVQAQTTQGFDPSGHWTGAIMQEGSVLPVEVTIEKGEEAEEGYRAKTAFPDWIFYRASDFDTVRVTDNGLVIEDLLGGDAILELEPKFEQLFGTLGEDGRRIHLRRSPPAPMPLVVSHDTSFTSADGTKLAGTLTLPEFGNSVAGMVLVRGRGCASRVNGRARFFARYGIAVLTYDKRGAGQSEGDCETFTLDNLTDDAIAAFDHLSGHPRVDARKVGFFGESAGAWIIQAAAERQRQAPESRKAAFLITWIGPSTSIIQQQVSSAATYGAAIGLSKERQEILAEVSRIIVDRSLSDDAAFTKLDAIRRSAEEEGWLSQGFGSDDIPRTRADMGKLWLRRFEYDPSGFLSALGDLPYLAVFGAKDPIVPVEENVAALAGTGSDVEVVVLPQSGHGYNFGERKETLSSGREVILFEGPDTGYATATIEFLRMRGFMSR